MNIALSKYLSETLPRFRSHSLSDLKNASLMNRVDTKFVVPPASLSPLFEALQNDFSALEISRNRIFRYQSTYFDTEDFELYHLHHNRRLNRHKVRIRHYVDADTHFLEVKFKNNKKRTIKTRIPVDAEDVTDISQYREFLLRAGLRNPEYLKPSLVSIYKRIAFANEQRGERLTIDFDLEKYNIVDGRSYPMQLSDTIVAELKQNRHNRHSPFFQVARDLNLRATSFSKYCIGMALTMPDNSILKSNRFKPITRRVSIGAH